MSSFKNKLSIVHKQLHNLIFLTLEFVRITGLLLSCCHKARKQNPGLFLMFFLFLSLYCKLSKIKIILIYFLAHFYPICIDLLSTTYWGKKKFCWQCFSGQKYWQEILEPDWWTVWVYEYHNMLDTRERLVEIDILFWNCLYLMFKIGIWNAWDKIQHA